jgi:hypothetical protein
MKQWHFGCGQTVQKVASLDDETTGQNRPDSPSNHDLTQKVMNVRHIRCPTSSVAQRSLMNHHIRHLGGFKTRVVDDH